MTVRPQDDGTDFDDHLTRWREWASSPWGRIRFSVVRRTLSWQVDALGGGPLRVLDVGGGDGRDSLPLAQQGHAVTVVDPSPGMLAAARSRAEKLGVSGLETIQGSVTELEATVGTGYDLVLCHFVLQYRPPGLGDLVQLASTLRPGGRLSVIAPNPVGAILAQLVRQGPAAALHELTQETLQTATFQQEVRKIEHDQMTDDLAAVGLEVIALYGGRCANDLVADDSRKSDQGFYADLERLELELCDREPFKRTGMFWQLVARSPAEAGTT